jgi:hypothetical protein
MKKEPKKDLLMKMLKAMEVKVQVEGTPLSDSDFKS